MFVSHLKLLRCPSCHSELRGESFPPSEGQPEEIREGVLRCEHCALWFPVQDGVVDLLTGELGYPDALEAFWTKHEAELTALGLSSRTEASQQGRMLKQKDQQRHHDWFADNMDQTYTEFAETPFWRGFDQIVMQEWTQGQPALPQSGVILEVGCGQGRFTCKLFDRELDIIAFDVSKKMVAEAGRVYEQARRFGADAAARITFMTADAMAMPVRDDTFNVVILNGVLHHLPDPRYICAELSKALVRGGVYFGMENNASKFRFLFDLLQRFFPLWDEEAGPEPTFSHETLASYLTPVGISLEYKTHVFIPPHVVDWFSDPVAKKLLEVTDGIGMMLPFFRDNGGLITFTGRKM